MSFLKRIKLDDKKMPKHIAFIIDGNGRWAKKRGLPRTVGHSYGVLAVEQTIKNCIKLNIPIFSFYVFSTENWKRSQEEIDAIFALLREYLNKINDEYKEENIKLLVSGDLEKLPTDLQKSINNVIEKTKNNNKFILNICLNYGGRSEIVSAVNKIISSNIKQIDETTFKNYLYTNELPDPDFVIRTSGELRTSNFMPYQTAYAEWFFPKTLWPDFNKKQLFKALCEYQKRNRRFGAVKENKTK